MMQRRSWLLLTSTAGVALASGAAGLSGAPPLTFERDEWLALTVLLVVLAGSFAYRRRRDFATLLTALWLSAGAMLLFVSLAGANHVLDAVLGRMAMYVVLWVAVIGAACAATALLRRVSTRGPHMGW